MEDKLIPLIKRIQWQIDPEGTLLSVDEELSDPGDIKILKMIPAGCIDFIYAGHLICIYYEWPFLCADDTAYIRSFVMEYFINITNLDLLIKSLVEEEDRLYREFHEAKLRTSNFVLNKWKW